MASETAPLVSGSSVMLAAFGFFYNAVKDRMDDAADATTTPATEDAGNYARVKIKAGRNVAWLLAAVALIAVGLLTPQVVHEVRAAIAVDFSLHKYSTLDTIFVVLTLGWLGVALLFGGRACKLTCQRRAVATYMRSQGWEVT